jgi:flagellar basal-body rod modification protein FlgD
MSDFISDLSNLSSTSAKTANAKSTNTKAGSNSLDMPDFLQLIVAQFQNQDPENAASTTDMMNMLVQMSVVQAVTTVTDVSTMLYTSSLVGKEVTIGQFDKSGKLQEIVGTVTATGTYNGNPVIYVNDARYDVSSILAVGKLPSTTTDATTNK